MAVNVTPLHDRVLVRRMENKETAKEGIIIPDSAKEKPQEGEVVAIGPGKVEKGQRIPLDVAVGDRILFGKYTGSDITIDGQEYLILREEEILGKLSGMAKAASGKKLAIFMRESTAVREGSITQEGGVYGKANRKWCGFA
jgi:chaperonin GroES